MTLSLGEEGRSVPLLEVAELLRGVSYRREEARTQPTLGLLPVLRANNIQDGRLVFDDLVYVPSHRLSPAQRLRRGDIVIAMSSGSRDIVGKGALVTSDWEGGFGAFCGLLRARGGAHPEFLFHFLQSPLWREAIERIATGTNINNLSRTTLSSIKVPLFPPDAQRQLAGLLSVVDECRRSSSNHLSAARRAIDRFRQTVLGAACSGRLTEHWREAHPHVSAEDLLRDVAERREALMGSRARPPSPIESQDLPSLPTSWRWASVDSLALRVVDGVHKTPTYRETGVPFVTVRNLTAGPGLSLDNTRFISEEDHAQLCLRAKPERGDLLISKDGTIGVTRAIRTDQPFSIFVSVALVKPVFQTMTDYLELALSSSAVRRQMIGVGSGLQHLVLRDLKADGVPIPPLEEQAAILRRASRLLAEADRLVDSIDRASGQLKRSKTALLAKAFHGELVTKGNGSG